MEAKKEELRQRKLMEIKMEAIRQKKLTEKE